MTEARAAGWEFVPGKVNRFRTAMATLMVGPSARRCRWRPSAVGTA